MYPLFPTMLSAPPGFFLFCFLFLLLRAAAAFAAESRRFCATAAARFCRTPPRPHHRLAHPALDEADHAAGKGGLFSLDTLVTVVDSTSFLEEVRKADDLEERGLEAEEGDTRTIADLLVSQARRLALSGTACIVGGHVCLCLCLCMCMSIRVQSSRLWRWLCSFVRRGLVCEDGAEITQAVQRRRYRCMRGIFFNNLLMPL